MPVCKAYDVAYVRFSVPDLDKMQEFLEAFGLRVVHRTADVMYSRGIAAAPFHHIVHRGPPKFIGFAFTVRAEADLAALAAHVPGCSTPAPIGGIEGELGGGRRVHFVDLNGFIIEAVCGQSAEPLQSARGRLKYNHAGVYDRQGVDATGANILQDVGNRPAGGARRDPGAPEVRRLGHCVLCVPPPRLRATLSFFKDTFGLIPSDSIAPGGNPERIFGQFLHMDRGDEYTDHHSMFILPEMDKRAQKNAQLSHVAFEVQSIDDVFRGHVALSRRKKYALAWGIGRHTYGSQVYDYWHDPWGHVHEHWCDGDRVNSRHPHRVHDPAKGDGRGDNQWGPTVETSNPGQLNGPQMSPGFAALPEAERRSLVSRDLSEHAAIVARL